MQTRRLFYPALAANLLLVLLENEVGPSFLINSFPKFGILGIRNWTRSGPEVGGFDSLGLFVLHPFLGDFLLQYF